MALDEAPQLLLRLLDVELGVVLHRLGEPVVAGHGRVVLQAIQDEALLDGLLHGVAVEGAVPDGAVGLRVGLAEDLALEPRQELAPRRAVLVQRERFGDFRLRGVQEGGELDPIDAELAVVVVGIAAAPADPAVARARLRNLILLGRIAGMAGQRRADEAFEAAFGGIGDYVRLPCSRNGLITSRPS